MAAYAYGLGIDAIFFCPVQRWAYGNEARGLLTDPNVIMPDATCMIALLKGYKPFVARTDGQPDLSAFYIASNALYHTTRQLQHWAEIRGFKCVLAELPAKGFLAQMGIASKGKNSLMATKNLGSRFTVQWMICSGIEHEPFDYQESICIKCMRCARNCPVGAITEKGLNPERCIRFHMNGHVMPQWVKRNLHSLLGCERCQTVCPRNHSIGTVDLPGEIAQLLTFERIFAQQKDDKKAFASCVGKNMLSRKRLQAQALCLAANKGKSEYKEFALRVAMEEQSQCLMDAGRWYIHTLECNKKLSRKQNFRHYLSEK